MPCRNDLVALVVATVLLGGCPEKKADPPSPSADPTASPSAAAPPASASPTAAASASSSAGTVASASPSTAPSAAPSASSPSVAIASAQAAGAASGSARAGACGSKTNPCPLQGWMQANANPATASGDAAEIAKVLDQIATFAPPPYPNWASISKDGARAARANDVPAAKAACRGCHDQYKAKYKAEMRDRKI